MSQTQSIVDTLRGSSNIVEIGPCIIWLHCELEDGPPVDKPTLKTAEAHSVVRPGDIVQAAVGPNADTIAENIEDPR